MKVLLKKGPCRPRTALTNLSINIVLGRERCMRTRTVTLPNSKGLIHKTFCPSPPMIRTRTFDRVTVEME